MKFRIVPWKHDGGYKWKLEQWDEEYSGWTYLTCFTWKWQAKRLARHLATKPEEFEV